ncbi:Transposon Ty3-I Gag-Pol polyprotein [Sparassis crispa]|uniref:Transposon Ty3-I Gag-Pol polyprotein n=1 Tax=Sparassis crispa TaxID=139825 RepID=A0A401H2H2_9APHY|nr:Transposon Ty3-I Gag-Pol polyprotein [Sparassis crispa]GBE88592.1 Transposon Ty3-I Gag-Pol polyprotein [Sparassis crispa]
MAPLRNLPNLLPSNQPSSVVRSSTTPSMKRSFSLLYAPSRNENFGHQKNLSHHQACWQEFLGQYDFSIIYLRGEDNTAANALSRLPPPNLSINLSAHPAIALVISDSTNLTPTFAPLITGPTCGKNLKSSTSPPAKIASTTSRQHTSLIAIDFIGPLPEDEGFNCIVTMTDRLGSDVRIVPTHTDIFAEDFTALFFERWYCENGLPLDIIFDHDHLFISQFWQALHKLSGIKLKMSTSYHPETDGSSEHSNKTVIQMLRYHVAYNQMGWVHALPLIRFQIVNSENASTGFTPFQLNHGRAMRVIPPILASDIAESTVAHGLDTTRAAELLNCMELDALEVQDNLFLAKSNQALSVNAYRYMQRGDNHVAKFMVRYNGPYTVTRTFPAASNYVLELPPHMDQLPSYHASLLHPYCPNDASLFPSREHPRPGPIVMPDGEEE